MGHLAAVFAIGAPQASLILSKKSKSTWRHILREYPIPAHPVRNLTGQKMPSIPIFIEFTNKLNFRTRNSLNLHRYKKHKKSLPGF